MSTDSTIILLHGIWQQPWAMWPLAQRLRRAGHKVELFGYGSMRMPPEAIVAHLQQRVAVHGHDHPVHLVGHSMGGVLSVQAAASLPDSWQGRVVCLGSPLLGSSTARHLSRGRLTRALLGTASSVLTESRHPWVRAQRVGVIAGTRRWGVGRVLHRLEGDHDGTVGVEETRLPGIHDHCTVPCSHTTLVHSTQVVGLIDHFLRHGSFRP